MRNNDKGDSSRGDSGQGASSTAAPRACERDRTDLTWCLTHDRRLARCKVENRPTASSAMPYDRRYSGEHRTSTELGNQHHDDHRAADDVVWSIYIPIAADRRIAELLWAWFPDRSTRLNHHNTLRRVIAIGLSTIDLAERWPTEFVREQQAAAEMAIRIIDEERRKLAAEEEAAKFYHPADAPISPTDKKQRPCPLNPGTGECSPECAPLMGFHTARAENGFRMYQSNRPEPLKWKVVRREVGPYTPGQAAEPSKFRFLGPEGLSPEDFDLFNREEAQLTLPVLVLAGAAVAGALIWGALRSLWSRK